MNRIKAIFTAELLLLRRIYAVLNEELKKMEREHNNNTPEESRSHLLAVC